MEGPTQNGEILFTTPGLTDLQCTLRLSATSPVVFNAWTDPDVIPTWLHTSQWPMVECVSDARPGGELRYRWRTADGKETALRGTFLSVEPPTKSPMGRIVHQEVFEPDWTDGPATVTTLMVPDRDSSTRLSVTIRYVSQEMRDRVAHSPMIGAMEENFSNLHHLFRRDQ